MEVSDIGTGNGSSGFTCRISPADEVGIIENLLERIRKLETEVARMKSGDIQVNQLSDLSQQVGWVGGVTYLGTEGWTRTEAGTLIPPPGWSLSGAGLLMSDGTPYQGVVMDENGVLQFGWMTDGTLGGAKVEQWDAGATPGGALDYARVEYNAGQVGGAADYSTFRGPSMTLNTLSDTQLIVNITQAGLYVCAAAGRVGSGGLGTNVRTRISIRASNDPSYILPSESYESDTAISGDASAGGIARQIYFSSGEVPGTIYSLLRNAVGTSTTSAKLNIVRLSA
jgi:hypothetical protein